MDLELSCGLEDERCFNIIALFSQRTFGGSTGILYSLIASPAVVRGL